MAGEKRSIVGYRVEILKAFGVDGVCEQHK